MRTAVLFLCHIVNEETMFRYNLLKKACNELGYDLYWAIDGENRYGKENLPVDVEYHKFSFSQYSADYPFIIYNNGCGGKRNNAANAATITFHQSNLNKYDYVWVIEYDACYVGEWRDFFRKNQDSDADLITSNFICSIRNMYDWWFLGNGRCDRNTIMKIEEMGAFCRSLNCICRLSNRLLCDIYGFLRKNGKGQLCFYEWVWPTVAKGLGYKIVKL